MLLTMLEGYLRTDDMKFYTNTDTLWLSTAYLKQSVFVLRLCPSQFEVSPGNHSASNLTAFKSIRYLKFFCV